MGLGVGRGRRVLGLMAAVCGLALTLAVAPVSPVAQAEDPVVAAPVVTTPLEGQRVYGGGYTAIFHVAGTAEPGATVRVYEDSVARFICTLTANAQGTWSCSPGLGHPAYQDQTFTLRVTAEVGGVTSEETVVTFIQDSRWEFSRSYPDGQVAPDGQTVLRTVITLDPRAPGGEFTVTASSVDPGAVEFLNLPVTSVGHEATVELRVVEPGKHTVGFLMDGQPPYGSASQFYQSDLQVTGIVPAKPDAGPNAVVGQSWSVHMALASSLGLTMTGLASSISAQIVNTTNPGGATLGFYVRDCSIASGCPAGSYWLDFSPRQAGVYEVTPVIAGFGAFPEHTFTVTVLDACVGEGCVTGLLSWSTADAAPGETVTAQVVVAGEGGAPLVGRTVDFTVDNPQAVVSASTCVTDEDGACQVEVVLDRDGSFRLTATVDGIVIPGSTTEVMVRGTLDLGASTFTIANRQPAPGASTGARVELRDAAGLPISNATVWLVAPGTTAVRFSVLQTCTYQGASACQRLVPYRNGDGTVSTSVISEVAGSAVIEAYVEGDGPSAVTIDGTTRAQRIGSPITVTWTDTPDPEPEPEPTLISFTVTGDEPVLADGSDAWVGTLTADPDGMSLDELAGLISFTVARLDGGPGEATSSWVDNRDGTYTARFTSPSPGQYAVIPNLGGVPATGLARQIEFVACPVAGCGAVPGSPVVEGFVVVPTAGWPVPADGVASWTGQILVTRDGEPAAGLDLGDLGFLVDPAVTVGPMLDAGDGKYTVTFTAAAAGQYEVVPTYQGVAGPAAVLSFAEPPCAQASCLTVTVNPSSSQVAPDESVHVVVDVRDQAGPVADEPVALSVDDDTVFPSTAAGTTGADGTYTATFIPSQPGQFTLTATVRGESFTAVVVVAAAPAPVLSGVLVVSDDVVAVAYGSCGAAPVATPGSLTARVVVTDEQGLPVAGVTVDFAADAPLDVAGSAVTTALGVAEVAVAVTPGVSAVSGLARVTASVDGVVLATGDVTIEASVAPVPIVDPVLTARPTSGAPVLADGQQSWTALVEFIDACGQPVPDAEISFAVTGDAQVSATARTAGDGQAVVTVTDSTAEVVTLSASWVAGAQARPLEGSPLTLQFAPVPPAAPTVAVTVSGKVFTFTGTGFAPGERVSAAIAGDRAGLGTQRADSAGRVVFTWTVPAGYATGPHQITLTGPDSGPASTSFTVTADQTASNPSGGWPLPGILGPLAMVVAALITVIRWVLRW